MESALLIDIGSTYTKVFLIDIDNIKLVSRNKAYTTVDEDVTIGLKKALTGINGWEKARYKLACSSAAGGLKMVAIGLVPDLTAEAAKRAALGAGARVLKTYSYELSNRDISDIEGNKPDIILLAGGTDGGNKEIILHNARKLAESKLEQVIIIAGNRAAREEIEEILNTGSKEFYICENVMPQLEELNVESSRELIRKIFLKKIIHAKGLDKLNNIIDGVIMPTPAAVLKAAELLAKGYKNLSGIGELIVVDIGGATTDVHSIATGKPEKIGVNWRGLEEAYAKRTVEGDLGMRYSALSLLSVIGEDRIREELREIGNFNIDISRISTYVERLIREVDYLPDNEEEEMIDNILAYNAIRLAISRHVGRLRTVYTPLGATYIQEGKDLSKIKHVIGTGGIVVNNDNPGLILKGSLYKNQDDPGLLAPINTEFMVDREYLLASAGLLSEIEPEISLNLMKKYIVGIS
jgi:uncharacterized protein (TIGR01319 family)